MAPPNCYCCCCLCVDPRDSGESSLAEKTRGQTPRKINSRKEEVPLGTNSRVLVRFFFLLLFFAAGVGVNPYSESRLGGGPGVRPVDTVFSPLKPSACERLLPGRGDCGPANPPPRFFSQQPTYGRPTKLRVQRLHVLHTGFVICYFFFARLFQLAKSLPFSLFFFSSSRKREKHAFSTFGLRIFSISFAGGTNGDPLN